MIEAYHIALDGILLTFLIFLAVGVAAMRNLFGAIILANAFSLVIATLFVLLDAVDVAFTEAAVGAGLSTILLLSAMALAPAEEQRHTTTFWPALVAVIAAGCLIFYGTLDLPPHGAAGAPVHIHVAPEYLANTEHDTGIPNVVTAILASYRGFDTLGEVYVIFTAGIAVLGLLAVRQRRKRRP